MRIVRIMSALRSRETRRYRAEMPASACQGSRPPRLRSRKRVALEDLAAGLARHLAEGEPAGSRAAWAEWAMRTGAGCALRPAPDGTSWSITIRIDYGA
jgi:hypothetical protein